MKAFVLALVMNITLSSLTQAQTTAALNGQDGVIVKYELSKISDNDKKDKYIIVATAVNTNDYDLYYAVPMTKGADGKYKLNSYDNKSFCEVRSKNAIGILGFLGESAKLTGEETSINTRGNAVLFRVRKGQTIRADVRFSVKPDQLPIVSNSFRMRLKKMEEFDLVINNSMVNGRWKASCGDVEMSLIFVKNEQGQSMITQYVNGRQQVWFMISENYFEKPGDKNATLTYNKSANIFTYTNFDGVICIWSKK